MAKRATATRSSNGIVVVQQPVPVARTSSGGGVRRRRSSGGGGGKRRRRSRSHSSGGGSAGIQTRIQRTALGGFAYGTLLKLFPNLPTLPLVGRSGTVALAIWFLKPKSQLLHDVGVAAAAIAGASFGQTGTVSGDGDEVLEG